MKKCPNCNTSFNCTADRTCWCFSAKAQTALAQSPNIECLCKNCLTKNLSEDVSTESVSPLYYFENGLMVMTAQYHLNRGSCCKNGCRHCPY